MKKYLSVMLLVGAVGTQAMADYRCVAVRGLGTDTHTFVVDGLVISGHEGTGRDQGTAYSNANNSCLNSGHARCRVISCNRTNDTLDVIEHE